MSLWRTQINDPSLPSLTRLTALRAWSASGPVRLPGTREVNNHVHTCYSFSPYTPSMVVLKAWEAGLEAVGSVDHDSVGAARETLEAGIILGLATTVGCELRVSFAETPFSQRKINFPECSGKAYMVFHGVPLTKLTELETYLKPLRAVRTERTREMTRRASSLFTAAGLPALDYDRHVAPLTKASEGGGVTERHLCAAAAWVLQGHAGSPRGVLELLQDHWNIAVPGKLAEQLAEDSNAHLLFDLVGLLKTTFLDQVFIPPTEAECPPVGQATEFARSLGAIPAYAYLGDVDNSPTGDKRAEAFEDSYLDDLMGSLRGLGFQAVTYMPPRNTLVQLQRVQRLCRRHSLMEISGVDINSSRQSFQCPEVLLPEFAHLNESTWALIAHEKLAGIQPELGLFHPRNPLVSAPLNDRLAAYARVGKAMDPKRPSTIEIPRLSQVVV